jgi:ABC-type lipoprotein release transport system permease subunit
MQLKLAWRNIWRNKRRTFITLGSVFFAVILSTLMMSIKEGIYARMISSMVGTYTGYIQVHAPGYWEDRSLDDSMVITDSLLQTVTQTNGVTGYVPRIENFALAASEDVTKGSMVVGVDIELEKQYSAIHERISDGSYLEKGDRSVLVGAGLAEYLKLGVGDTIVLLGAGYHGVSAAGKYPIKGIVKFGSPDLSKQLVILPLPEAQWFYGAENKVTNMVVLVDDPDDSKKIQKSLKTSLSDSYDVMHWEEMSPDIKKLIETDRVEGYVFMFILYMVIAFGIFGTMLMMMAERMHEFGVLIAVGMKRVKLAVMVWIETVMISLLGAFLGMFGALPVCAYFYYWPIEFSKGDEMAKMYEEYGMEAVLQASIEPTVFLQQAAVVALVATVIAVYPFLRILRLKAINAMSS